MNLLTDLIRYFKPKKRFRSVPLQVINPYTVDDLRNASEQEKLLMLAGVARSPDAARDLLDRYNTKSATEVLKRLPKRRKATFKKRLIDLIRRWEGHRSSDPYRCEGSDK